MIVENKLIKLFGKEENQEKVIFYIFGFKFKFKKVYLPLHVEKSAVKISVVINTYNAERLLEGAIKSVLKADEIIVCDMYSTDKTIEIAEKYGCKIYYHEKLPQPDPARNFAISKATGDWILILDADEIIPNNLWEYLVDYANAPLPNKLAVSLRRKNWFLDGFLTNVGEDYQLRFFKKGHIEYEEGHVHVPPKTINTEVLNLNAGLCFYHYSYKNISDLLNRQNVYTTEEVKKTDLSKVKKSCFKIWQIIFKYFKIYLVQRRFKDGFRGFVWCIYDAFYEINIYIKALEAKERFEDKQQESSKLFLE